MGIDNMIKRSVNQVKDIASSVSNSYDKTQLNPFKVPDKVTIKVDLLGSYADLLTAIEKMTPEKAERILKAVNKVGTIFEKAIDTIANKKKK